MNVTIYPAFADKSDAYICNYCRPSARVDHDSTRTRLDLLILLVLLVLLVKKKENNDFIGPGNHIVYLAATQLINAHYPPVGGSSLGRYAASPRTRP